MNPTPSDRLLAFWFRRNWRGFHLLLRAHRRLTGRSTLRVRSAYGSLFELPPHDYIPAHVLREGYYESEVLEALRPNLGSGAVLWDVGTNLGLHAVTAKVLSPITTVVAFEPNPAMVVEIRRHAKLNSVDLRLASMALGACDETRPLHIVGAGNPGMSTLHPWSEARYDTVTTVECARGDTLIARGLQPTPTVIKLDVEGGEADVLAGLPGVLSSLTLRAVVFEGAANLDDTSAAHPVAGPLLRAGFRLSPLFRREATNHNLGNYLAARD